MNCNKTKCTCFIDGIKNIDWSDCCHSHDIAYLRKKVSRKEADRKLFECVKSKSIIVAIVMYVGVRFFGWYFWKKT